jgi:glycosyltransferase involved in cell wall biosynthesis
MKILFLTWEFPPMISGGLAMACYGMVKSLLKRNIEIILVLPTKIDAYFILKNEEDVDNLKPIFINSTDLNNYEETFLKRKENININIFDFLGISEGIDAYSSSSKLKSIYLFSDFVEEIEKNISNPNQARVFEELRTNLLASEDLFRKVREYTNKISKLVNLIDFDLVHAHDWLCYPAGILASKIKNKPLVSHIHATEFDRSGGVGDERIHKIEYIGLSLADRVISVSNYTANLIVNRYRIDTAKIRVIHNAFHLKNAHKEKKRIFKDPVILFLGRITLQKGPEYFLDVAKRIIKTYPMVRFIMVGTGDLATKLIKKSAKENLLTRFLFTGFLNREEVESILSATDIMILPSVSEPFGIAPLEAMSFGIATIISKQSGVSEIVENVFKVDFWDVDQMTNIILDLLADPVKMRSIGELAAEEVTKIQWDKSAKMIEECYKELLC